MGGAPTVLNTIVNSPISDRRLLPHKVEVMTGGAPPPPQILSKMEELGFGISHLYGRTETYGPGTSCIWKPEWDSLPLNERYKLKARQGVHHVGLEDVEDRLKDVIISGGENISTVEVETILYSHLAILEAAVVAQPDNHWGQTPCAFVKLKEGYDGVGAQEIIKFCRDHLPHYMTLKTVIFEDLPKTSTGKIQKVILREKAKAMGSLS
ncbi:hypothetical protein SO802_022055 [Lithocarpus litseifolius]|uniref:Uncharacterized protein n=1 Tax=Lithocarpus litseifolius TaxID=425828 RepID=A0AAW2CKY1_9ROSI